MARLSKTLLDKISGGLGKQLVFKQYMQSTGMQTALLMEINYREGEGSFWNAPKRSGKF